MRKERLYELDILRALGTFIIVFHHLPDYAGNFYDLTYFGISLDLSYINVINTYFGLGVFVFVSGFVLAYTSPHIDDISLFLKRRAVRIFPLYLVALALFALVCRELDLPEALIHILGLQILLAPRFVAPITTLWFIGLVVILYVVYAFLSRYTRGWLGTLCFALVAFGLFLLARILFGIFEYRFFAYFPVFLAGILCHRTNLLDRNDFGAAHVLIAVLVLCVSVLMFRYSHQGSITGEVSEELISQASLAEILMTSIFSNVMMLTFIFVAFVSARNLKTCLKRTSLRCLSFVSFSSYCIYLFHRPVLDVMARVFSSMPHYYGYWRLLFLIAFGLPVILVLSYIAQVSNDKIVERLCSLTISASNQGSRNR